MWTYTTFYLSIYQLIVIWIISTFWILWIRQYEHLRTSFCMDVCFKFLWIYAQDSVISRSWGTGTVVFHRSWMTTFPPAMFEGSNFSISSATLVHLFFYCSSFFLFLIIAILCMLSHISHVQFLATLWTIACQTPLSIGFSRHKYWSGLPWPPPGDLRRGSWQESNSYVSCIGRQVLYLRSHLGNPAFLVGVKW